MKEKIEKKIERKKASDKTESINDFMDKIDKELNLSIDGTITEVNPISNKLFFGDNGGTFDVREGFAVTVKIDSNNTEFTQWFSKPDLKGYKHSNLYAFKLLYGSLPKTDLKVKCIIDDNGFFKIKIAEIERTFK